MPTNEHRLSEDDLQNVDDIPRWVDAHSVTCPLCGDLADERETVDLWNEPRFPDGEAHQSCYNEWEDKSTYIVLDLNSLYDLHPDASFAGDHIRVSVKGAYLDRNRADNAASGAGHFVVKEVTDDDLPRYFE